MQAVLLLGVSLGVIWVYLRMLSLISELVRYARRKDRDLLG